MTLWEFERDGEVVRVDPTGPLIVQAGGGTDLAVDAAIAGTGIISFLRGLAAPASRQRRARTRPRTLVATLLGAVSLLPGRRLVPAPLRAFVDFIKVSADEP